MKKKRAGCGKGCFVCLLLPFIAVILASLGRSLTHSPTPNLEVTSPPVDLDTVTSTEMPAQVRLKLPAVFKGSGADGRTFQFTVLSGGVVNLVGYSSSRLSLSCSNAVAEVEPASTDIVDRIQAIREGERVGRTNVQPSSSPIPRISPSVPTWNEPGPEPEASAWDGSPPIYVKTFMSRILRDPDSVQYMGTLPARLVTYQREKCWALSFRYRARNGFGGYNIEEATVYVHGERVIGIR